MKIKTLCFIFTFVCVAISSHAKIWTVTVANFQFNPAVLNVVVGDTVRWTYISGFHTTTSLTMPAGAQSWDAPMQSAGAKFDYIIKKPGAYTYDCTIHPTSMKGTINASGALPVVLNSFAVFEGKIKGTADIRWSTATEINTAWFIIKKSTDGESYSQVAKVQASGNSTTLQQYLITDKYTGNASKYIFYMIEILDKDGSSSFSPVIRYNNSKAVIKLVTQISPNPVAAPGHLMFQFNADKEDEMKVQLYDASGKFIKEAFMHAEAGLNNGHFHLGNIAAGIYNVVFSMNGRVEKYKVVMR